MKKFIKFFIIALMVVAAVTFTCYMFFKNLKQEKELETSLIEFSESGKKENFNTELEKTINIVNSDKTDNRFEVMQITLNNLDSSMQVLSSYYIDSNGVVKDKEINNAVSAVYISISTASSIMSEINIKAFLRNEDGEITGDNTYYNRHLGANDLYRSVSNYIVNYSKLIKLVNKNITSVDKSADIRFSAIELYSDVAINTFSNIKQDIEFYEIADYANINLINSAITWSGYRLNLAADVSLFDVSVYNFSKYYNLCNKESLAKNLNSICSNVSGVVNPTNEQWAAIYFKEVFGL